MNYLRDESQDNYKEKLCQLFFINNPQKTSIKRAKFNKTNMKGSMPTFSCYEQNFINHCIICTNISSKETVINPHFKII